MQTEYNAADETTAIAPPSPSPTPPSQPQYGEGYEKALKTERGQRQALEKERAQLLELVAQKERQLEQTNLTLEEKYRQDGEQYKAGLLTEAQQAIAERDQRFQVESEARQAAEQRSQILEEERAASSISGEFFGIFSQVLVNPKKVDAYLAEIRDDLVVDVNGQPALIARRDEYGRAVELAPISAAIGYFQERYPEDFRPPADQKTGGGYRNLAAGAQNPRNGSEPIQIDYRNVDAKTFLANREAIRKGDFEVIKK